METTDTSRTLGRSTSFDTSNSCSQFIDRPARLLIIITSPMSAAILMRGQLAFMKQQGFDVTLVSSPGRQLDIVAEREGINVVPVRMERNVSLFWDFIALIALIRVLCRVQPVICHCSTPKAGLLGGIAALIARVPIRIFTLRGIRADGLRGVRAKSLLLLESLSCRLSHRVVCISQSLAERAIDMRLLSAEKITVLESGSSNGIDSKRFAPSEEILKRAFAMRKELGLGDASHVVGFVGRICKDKGIFELLEAFEQLRSDYPHLHLLLVGPIEAQDEEGRQIRNKLEGDTQILITGFLEDTAPAYALMDVLAFPTYREGFGNVALEAAAMEIPVVASRVTGCTDSVQDGGTGTLVPPRGARELEQAIRMYIENPELRREHGEAGRERVLRDFRPETVWESLHNFYIELGKKKGLVSHAN